MPRTWAEIRAAAQAASRKPAAEEILECQDELAEMFENYEAGSGDTPEA